VIAARALMVPLAEDLAIFDDDGADVRVGRRATLLREQDGVREVLRVGCLRGRERDVGHDGCRCSASG
jgi:hypothetical protein